MQNEEPPKDARERGRKRDSLTFSGTFLVNFHQKEARGLDPPLVSFLTSPYRAQPRLAAQPEQLLRQPWPSAPPLPAPRVGFSQLRRLGQGLGCEESAPAARNGQVAATLVRLGVISSAEGKDVRGVGGGEARTGFRREVSGTRSRSGSCGRRQQKRREVPPGGGGRKTSGRRSAEPSVPTCRAYFLEGRGGGLGPGGGRPVARGLAKFRRRRWRRPSSAPTRGKFSPEASGRPAPSGAPSPEPSERAASQPGSGDTRAAMPGGCSRGPAAGDGRLRLARLALVLLGWVSSTSLPSSASSSTSSASLPAPAASGQPALPGRCPAPCECSEAARTVKCVNRNLTEVPADLPPYVRNLFLTGNQLAVLPAGAFARRPPLADLAALNLSGNRLKEVDAGAFEHLPGLRQLDLSHNPLADLSPFAFSGSNASVATPSPLAELILNRLELPAAERQNLSLEGMVAAALRAGHALRGLRRLELASNQLLYLPHDVLAHLPGLRHLDLRNNSLVGLTHVSFRNLTHLESLHLEDNALKVLRNGTLAELQSLPHVRVFLDDNPWVCDCHMVDMVAWLKETEVVQGKGRLTCAFPEKMRHRVLLELNSSDLDCDPMLPPSLQTSYVFLGIVLALIGAIFLLVLYLNRKGIKKWMHNIRDACRDHMEGYHYRYEINADPRLTNLSSNSDV